MLKKLVFLSVLLASSFVYAGSDQITNVSIIQVSTYDQYAVVYFSPEFIHTQTECLDMKNRAIIRFSGDTVTKKEMFSAALAAAMAGKLVTIGVNGCHAGYPNAYRVDIKI